MTTWTWSLLRSIMAGVITFITWTSVYSQTVLFPGMAGIELQDELRMNYRPSATLSLDEAKDTMYTWIDNVQDSVEGIYSGYRLYLPDGVDASQWLFMNGTGINLEHVYPQSKGADEGTPGHSDMHHLYPSRVAVNEARASFPFAEIPDNITTKWFTSGLTMQSIPTSNIDAYSESINGAFEPRESVKGNIARAVFYFYTMYKDDADAADPLFFQTQRQTLCAWHLEDPVDDAEQQRSLAVAQYQDGKENPFVLDCTAALRAWCPEFEGCSPLLVEANEKGGLTMRVYGLQSQIAIRFESDNSEVVAISVFDMSGRLYAIADIHIQAGVSEHLVDQEISPGIYVVTATSKSQNVQRYYARCAVY